LGLGLARWARRSACSWYRLGVRGRVRVKVMVRVRVRVRVRLGLGASAMGAPLGLQLVSGYG